MVNPTTPTPVDLDAIENMGDLFGDLGQEIIALKMEERNVLAMAAMDNGPNSIQEALKVKLDQTKMGMRELSRKTGVNRKLLLGMIEGRVDIPADVQAKIIEVIYNHPSQKRKAVPHG